MTSATTTQRGSVAAVVSAALAALAGVSLAFASAETTDVWTAATVVQAYATAALSAASDLAPAALLLVWSVLGAGWWIAKR